MQSAVTRRQFMCQSSRAAIAAAVGTHFFVLDSRAEEPRSKYMECFAQLDVFIEHYLREMNAPGMTMVMADRDGVQRVATYGFGNPEQKIAVKSDELFEIGSISKSFVANCLLQLNQEGKLDLNKPVKEYLPWFRIDSTFAPITVHHLLTHSSGLPGDAPVFLSDPSEKHHPAYAPGKYFHYCNTAYAALGHLASALDGRTLPEIFRRRIFEPLGMTQSEPVISLDIRDRIAKNYMVSQNDRPYLRHGSLSEAPAIVMTDGSGCIASTPRDMGLYIQMIAKHGMGPNGTILSTDSFALFSHPHIKADEFGPNASYGYGIAVDTLDGNKILRHTGGMVSFASAMHVDIDVGVGAFASINAMQGYRPNPVAQYAIQLMRAQRENKSFPPSPPQNPATQVKNAAEYVGIYRKEDGKKLEISASDQSLFLVDQSSRIPLENAGGDTFKVGLADFQHFVLIFGRADKKNPNSDVVEAGWGGEWFTNSKYTGPKRFDYPKDWDALTGHYRNESPWIGSIRIVVRKGMLMIDGVVPLEAGEGGIFFLRDEDHSPEWIRFGEIVNGRAMRLKFSGEDLWRVMTV